MTNASTSTGADQDTADASSDTQARRASGLALIVGAVAIFTLIQSETLRFYWFPLLTGLTYLAAAAAGRRRSTLWGPGLVITAAGLVAALWLRDGRMVESFEFLALTVTALGLGGVLAALLVQIRGFSISALSIALPVFLYGVTLLLEQQAVRPFAGQTWAYMVLLALWGGYELRPTAKR